MWMYICVYVYIIYTFSFLFLFILYTFSDWFVDLFRIRIYKHIFGSTSSVFFVLDIISDNIELYLIDWIKYTHTHVLCI